MTAPNADILKLALMRQLPTIVNALPAVACPTDLTVELVGVPGYGLATIKAASRVDGKIRAIVTHLDGVQLDPESWAKIDMEPPTQAKLVVEDDGSVAGAHDTRWYPVPKGSGLQPEPQGVDAAGQDIIAMVNTHSNCWRLTCSCGRTRYASRNNVSKVFLCRVCAKRRRRKTQTEWQKRQRAAASAALRSSTQTTTSLTSDEREPSKPDSLKPESPAE